MRTLQSAYLFEQFNRETYLAKTGKQAPTFNPALPPKSWFDPAKPSGGTYAVWDGKQLTSISISADQAGVNLPGLMTYPKYSPAPTPARMSSGSQIDPGRLCSEADARKLMQELGGSGLWDQAATAFAFFTVDYGSETRRMWAFSLPTGQAVDAAALLAQQYAHGVGAPGHWDTSEGLPRWVTEVPDQAPEPTMPPVPVPIHLEPGERVIITGGAITAPWIVKDGEDPNAPTASTGLTDADRQALLEIRDGVNALRAIFHV